jgi:hypothetical protein
LENLIIQPGKISKVEIDQKFSIVIDEIGPALKWATASVDSGSSGSSDMPKARDNFEENEAPF